MKNIPKGYEKKINSRIVFVNTYNKKQMINKEHPSLFLSVILLIHSFYMHFFPQYTQYCASVML